MLNIFKRLKPQSKNISLWNKPHCNFSIKAVPRGSQEPYAIKEQDLIHGFKVLKIEDAPLFSAKVFTLEHEVTKAKYFHLHFPDKNNTFAVIFRTSPLNDKGSAHILEHLVLCGSQTYPVRDPFMNMLKRSLNTYMNAWTGADYTCYPFSSQNEKDIQNLMHVYLDTVFRPNLDYLDFLQEGWRYEFANPEDPSSNLIYKGVVFNEMKGVFQSPDTNFLEGLNKNMFKDNAYHFCAGGIPKDIVSLPYEELVDFYKKYYHPSNAKFFSYGDMDFRKHLEIINEKFLKGQNYLEVKSEIPLQNKFSSPVQVEIKSPPEAVAMDPEKQTRFGISYLCNEVVSDPFTSISLNILSYMLFETPNSPFYKSLLEAGIAPGFCPGYGYEMGMKQGTFTIGVSNIKNDTKTFNHIEKIINETLEEVVKTGFDEEFVESVLHQIEVQSKVPKGDFGIGLLQSTLPFINHGGSPLELLRVNENINKIRIQVKKGNYFGGLVQKYLLNNPHRVKIVMNPDLDLIADEDKEEKRFLKAIQDKLTESQKNKIIEDSIKLKQYQEKIQDTSILPTLEIEDIPKTVEPTNFEKKTIMDIPVYFSEQPTNGLTFFRMKIDIKNCPNYIRPYLHFYSLIFPKCGSKTLKHNVMDQKLDLYTYNFEVQRVTTPNPNNTDDYEDYLIFSVGCLDKNIERMFDLITDLFVNIDFKDYTNVSQLLKIFSSEAANSFVENSLDYASSYASAGLRKSAFINEKLAKSRHLCLLGANILKTTYPRIYLDDFEFHLSSINEHLFNKNLMSIVVHSNKDVQEVLERRIELMLFTLKNDKRNFLTGLSNLSELVNDNPEETRDEGRDPYKFKKSLFKTHFTLPMQVNYVVESFATPHYTNPDTPKLQILAQLMSSTVLHQEIREKGGAYGAGATLKNEGTMNLWSYRDPHVLETYQAFEKAIQWASKGEMTEGDIKDAKMGVFARIDKVVEPQNKGMFELLHGVTTEMRQEFRERLLAVTHKDVKEVAEKYLLEAIKNAETSQVIFGSQNNNLEGLVSRGWKIEQPVEGLSVQESSYEQNKKPDHEEPPKLT